MKPGKRLFFDVLLALGTGTLLGSILAAFSPGEFLTGAWQSSLFCFLLSGIFLLVYRIIKPTRLILVLAICTFLLRIVTGIWLTTSLPTVGYDTPVQNAGYSYSDAYERDTLAYMKAFPGRFTEYTPGNYAAMDQYGGLITISAMIYSIFSTDTQRPLLIIYLSALMMSIGMVFLWKAISLRWGEKIALIAAIFFTVYPEGIILSSSQMREPFLIGLGALTFFEAILFSRGRWTPVNLIIFGLTSVLMVWISIPAGLEVLMMLVGFLLLDYISREQNLQRRRLFSFGFGLFVLAACFAGWLWLKDTLYYDAYVTETESGLISYILKGIGTKWRFPLVLLYGLIQPVLPAALVYQSLPLWYGIAVFRAIGWYFAIPFLMYGMGKVFTARQKPRDWGLIWFVVLLLVWTVVSSARAGGDQWDNPRYRAIFLPWLALLVGWVWAHLTKKQNSWFWRIILLEGMFVIIFTNWYLNRKYAIGLQIPVQYLLIFYAAFLIIVIALGLFIDHRHRKSNKLLHS
jgi:hypothetical protein